MKLSFKPNKLGIAVIIIVLVVIIAIGFKNRKQIKEKAVSAINWIKEKTWDIHTDRRIASVHPKILGKVKEFIIRAEKELGIKLRVTSAFRSVKEQEVLYQKHLKGGPLAAPPFKSYHNFGLAIDLVEIKNGKALWSNPNWEKIGKLGESIGFTWGGRWEGKKNDKPHFQMNFGKHHSELAQLYKAGKRDGEYVKL